MKDHSVNMLNNLPPAGCYGYRPELMIINEHWKYYSKDKSEHVYVYFKDSHGEATTGKAGPVMPQAPE